MDKIFYTNYLFEIRYEPNPAMLDKRGSITASVTNNTLKHWAIGANKIDFMSEGDEKVSAFISYQNLGLQYIFPKNKSDFINMADAFLKSVWPYLSNNTITRIGIKSTILIETNNFTDLFNKFVIKFLGLNEENLKNFGGQLIDVGFPLDFIDGDDYFSVTTGPMEKKQYNKELINYKDFSEASLLVEVDYFRKGLILSHINRNSVMQIIQRGSQKGLDIADVIKNILK